MDKKDVQCIICDEKCHNTQELQLHIAKHNSEGQYQCIYCNAVVDVLQYVEYHLFCYNDELMSGVHKCPVEDCNSSYSSNKYLRRHINKTHGSEDDYNTVTIKELWAVLSGPTQVTIYDI